MYRSTIKNIFFCRCRCFDSASCGFDVYFVFILWSPIFVCLSFSSVIFVNSKLHDSLGYDYFSVRARAIPLTRRRLSTSTHTDFTNNEYWFRSEHAGSSIDDVNFFSIEMLRDKFNKHFNHNHLFNVKTKRRLVTSHAHDTLIITYYYVALTAGNDLFSCQFICIFIH